MRINHVLFAGIFGLGIAASPANGQTALREGLKVRVGAGGPDITGVIQSVSPDSIILFTEPSGARLGIARNSIQSLKVSQGKTASQGAKKGAIWGLIIGGGSGVLMAAITPADDRAFTDLGISRGEFAAISVVEGLAIGAGIGALVRAEKWEALQLHPTVTTKTLGVSMGFSFR